MKRYTLTLLPYLVAFAVPTVVLGTLFLASGSSPLYGLFGGAIGLLGALLARAVQVLTEPRSNGNVEWLGTAAELRKAFDRLAAERERERDHEGLRRMLEDIDEAARRERDE